MKRIYLILVGDNKVGALLGDNEQASGSGAYIPTMSSIQDNTLDPIRSIINQDSVDNALPSQAIKLPTFQDSPFYQQALRYAYPEYSQEERTPGYRDSIVLANASNKTLGTFPIFGNGFAVIMPSFDKRKKAIGDYILELERMKSSSKPLPSPKFEYEKGNPDWTGVINKKALDKFSRVPEIGQQLGYDVGGATDVGHPLFHVVNQIGVEQKHQAEVTTNLKNRAEELEKLNLSSDNAIGRKANDALNEWRYYSSLPEDAGVMVNGKLVQGKSELIDDPEFIDRLSGINNTLGVVTSLHGAAAPILNDIKTKAVEYGKVHPGLSYNTIVTELLESQYPVQDQNGQPTKLDKDGYINELALDIAHNSPEAIQDIDPNNPNPRGVFKIQDLKDYIENQLGFKKSKTVYIQNTPGAGEGGANAKKDAFPQYALEMTSKMSSGQPYVTRDQKGSMTPGTQGVTFNVNGVTEVIPYSNKTAIMKKIAEMGGGTGEYGDIDAASAIANNLGNTELFKAINSKVENKRPKPDETGVFQTRFNHDLYEIAGNNGLPLVPGITVKSIKSLSSDRSDNDFFFNTIPNTSTGGKVTVSGAIVPEDVMKATLKNDVSFWEFWKDKTKTAYVPVDGTAMVLGGTMYHKNKKGDPDYSEGVETYTVYDQNTKKPYIIKDKEGDTHTITLNDYQVRAITDKPTALIKESEQKYPSSSDNSGESGAATYSQQNIATKKGGKAGVFAVEGVDDNTIKAAHVLLKGNPNLGSIDNAVERVKAMSISQNANDKDFYNKLLGKSSSLKTDSIRSLYK